MKVYNENTILVKLFKLQDIFKLSSIKFNMLQFVESTKKNNILNPKDKGMIKDKGIIFIYKFI